MDSRAGEEKEVIHTLVVLTAELKLNCRHAVSNFPNIINLMWTITTKEIVKFPASARLALTHFKFKKSQNVVILQIPQERSVTVKRKA